jgi:hypothetical protein
MLSDTADPTMNAGPDAGLEKPVAPTRPGAPMSSNSKHSPRKQSLTAATDKKIAPVTALHAHSIMNTQEAALWANEKESPQQKLDQFAKRHDEALRVRTELFPFEGGGKCLTGGQRAAILRTLGNQVAPMYLMPLRTIKTAHDAGTMDTLTYKHADVVNAVDLPDNCKILFVSHRWWSSLDAKPDQDGYPKATVLLDLCESTILKEMSADLDDCLVWWDFLSIAQEDNIVKAEQVACLSLYVSMADATVALRAGDTDYYDAMRQAVEAGTHHSDNEHAGHYNNRVRFHAGQRATTTN